MALIVSTVVDGDAYQKYFTSFLSFGSARTVFGVVQPDRLLPNLIVSTDPPHCNKHAFVPWSGQIWHSFAFILFLCFISTLLFLTFLTLKDSDPRCHPQFPTTISRKPGL
jgi:hypothetical protein